MQELSANSETGEGRETLCASYPLTYGTERLSAQHASLSPSIPGLIPERYTPGYTPLHTLRGTPLGIHHYTHLGGTPWWYIPPIYT